VKKKLIILSLLVTVLCMNSCNDLLTPAPIDQLVNDIVLNEPRDIEAVEVGLYNAFRGITATVVIAGDMTADNLIHNGTFSQYRELGVKKITSANATVNQLWGSIYRTIYIANFMLEKIPEIPGVSSAVRQRSMATAYYLRGMANFIGLVTYGGIPRVITTNIEDNRNIPRATSEEMLTAIESDFSQALGRLEAKGATPATASDYAVKAALARFYLYIKGYAQAETYASDIINSGKYKLEEGFSTVVLGDFPTESIFEVGYTIADDNDANNLNTLFVGRREIIPSNEEIIQLASTESGDRFSTIEFNVANLKGNDNGWQVAKYGTAVQDNNNVMIFRLAEMYLIRAEARALQAKVTGDNSAQSDINVLRDRANAPIVGAVSQSQMITLIEQERRYELAFEGHRWYDLTRTGRIEQVMPGFNSNWKPAYQLWPIPQRELQNNPSLAENQNPGY
jgi:hypothetical protein